MITENRRKFISIDRSWVTFRTPVEYQRRSDKRIRRIRYNISLLSSFVTSVALTLGLTLLPSTAVYAQQSAADKTHDQKSQTLRKPKTRRGRSRAKAQKGAGQNARKSQAAKRRENQKNGSKRTRTTKGGTDGSESADSASKRIEQATANEDGVDGLNDDDTAEQDVKTFDSALKGGATQRSNRMEFDARLVYGETAGSGAVILFERGQRHLPALTKQRTKFLSATTEPIFGKKDESHYRVRDDSKEVKSDKTEKKSAINGPRN